MKRRGQTLVIFSLTMLLMLLMVTMTLGIGMKAREKMEMQTVADAAAYSNAVATARSFNAISLMNRALIGHMVAMTGVESLISWSGYYRGSINAARSAYGQIFNIYLAINIPNCICAVTNAVCAQLCKCSAQAMSDINQAKNKLQQADNKLNQSWTNLDRPAGEEARRLQIGNISSEQKEIFRVLEEESLGQAKIASALVDEANKGSHEELKALTSAQVVNDDELVGNDNCTGKGAACTRRDAGHKQHFVYAAMGSRGFGFVTGREGGAMPLRIKLQTELPQRDVVVSISDNGSSYFPKAGQMTHSAQTIDATEVWGDDHDGALRVMFARGQAPCPVVMVNPIAEDVKGDVRSTYEGESSDRHTWTGGKDNDASYHTMGTCTACPGMWPPHMDYNYKNLVDAGGDNNNGQPKNYAIIQRDYSSRTGAKADPWNLAFRFRFSDQDTEFDNRGIKLVSTGLDISKATALSAGITYYKRKDHGREPPNFLNPFWRATLSSSYVDKAGQQDVPRALNGAASFASDVAKALDKAGYDAW